MSHTAPSMLEAPRHTQDLLRKRSQLPRRGRRSATRSWQATAVAGAGRGANNHVYSVRRVPIVLIAVVELM